MKTEKLIVNNMKCMGCVNAVKTGLSSIQGVSNVEVDLATATVNVTYEDDSVKSTILKKLDILGYPAKQ
ncbi:MAG: heavy-metal-associated domain-containing protein [Bacteroidales bacterium]